MFWPEVFNDPDKPYHPELDAHARKGAALADTLSGWACCMAGSKPPENFGRGMVVLNEITGCLTKDDAMAAAKEWRAE